MSQSAFQFTVAPSYAEEDFILSDANRMAREWLDRWPDGSSHALLLMGPACSGKTHLGQIFLARTGGKSLPADEIGQKTAEELLANPIPYLLDGIEKISNQVALAMLLNYAKDAGRNLLLSAASGYQPALPDLASRLSSLPRVEIGQPDDALLRGIIVKLLADRQLRPAPEVVEWVLKRADRSYAGIAEAISGIDRKALEMQRNITIPFLRELMSGK